MKDSQEIVDYLQTIPELQNVPREQLEWVVREGTIQEIPQGEYVKPGDEMDLFIIVLQGKFQFYSLQGGQRQTMFEAGPGMLTGLLPFSRMKASPVYAAIVEAVTLLTVHKSKFRAMISANYDLAEAIVHALSDRVRLFSSLHFQNEKMMALGKLSAGLAHELNNPAAAILRSAEELRRAIAELPGHVEAVAAGHVSQDEFAALKSLSERLTTTSQQKLPMLERRKREDAMTDWLLDNKLDDECAETFVEFGLSVSELDELKTKLSVAVLHPALTWLAGTLQAERLAREIAASGRRISELVQSVKSYTRMDQVQDMQPVAINDSIRDTLTMLQHKVRKNSITVHADLGSDLPLVNGFPGELTQVWTNIIDNALDAMKNGGDLTVKTTAEDGFVVFTVVDSGPGIPKENLEKIFDPFFTTKDVGEGTGVGLDLVQKVIRQHGGKIEVNSVPGRTEFRVFFPQARQ
jgi:signal transduction histidine kinase